MSDLLIRDMLPARVCPECKGSGQACREFWQQRAICPRCKGDAVILIGAPSTPRSET